MLTPIVFAAFGVSSIALPGGPPVGMDYLAVDDANHRVLVPAGNTGNLDVIDTETGKVRPIGGFSTVPASRPGRPNMGPSSVTYSADEIWVGNRGDDTLHPFNRKTLEKKAGAVKLPTMPDGIQWVAKTSELWSTTPRDNTITIVAHGKVVETVKLPGAPEGSAV